MNQFGFHVLEIFKFLSVRLIKIEQPEMKYFWLFKTALQSILKIPPINFCTYKSSKSLVKSPKILKLFQILDILAVIIRSDHSFYTDNSLKRIFIRYKNINDRG